MEGNTIFCHSLSAGYIFDKGSSLPFTNWVLSTENLRFTWKFLKFASFAHPFADGLGEGAGFVDAGLVDGAGFVAAGLGEGTGFVAAGLGDGAGFVVSGLGWGTGFVVFGLVVIDGGVVVVGDGLVVVDNVVQVWYQRR